MIDRIRKPYWTLAAFLFGAFLLYGNTLRNPFLNHDDWWIVHAGKMREWLTPHGLLRLVFDLSWTARMEHGAEYLPLRDLVTAIENLLFGNSPVGYHVVQILLFGLSCWLLFRLIETLGGGIRTAWIAALLFLAHPIHVESVAWLSGQKDLLSLLFLLALFLAYARGRIWLSLIFFCLALTSKYQVLVAPLLLPFIDLSLSRQVSGKRLAPFVGLALGSFVVASLVGETVNYGHIRLGSSAWAVVRNLPVVFEISIRRLLVPTGLQIYYPYEPAGGWFDFRAWGGILFFALGTSLLIRFRRSALSAFAATLILAGLAPMFRAPEMHFLADRYLLIPSIGTAILLGTWLSKISRRNWLWGGSGALLLTYSVLTVLQNQVWRDSRTLWEHAAYGERPVHKMVWRNVAVVARDDGDWQRSAEGYRNLLSILPPRDPSRADALTNLGFVEIQRGNPREAEGPLRNATELDPRYTKGWMNLGVALAMQRRLDDARSVFEVAHQLDPANPEILFNLGRLAADQKRRRDVEDVVAKLRKLGVGDPRLRMLDGWLGSN
ncbi:MAG: tetratricopeptide repeat protein [Pseudomonadota bacterium]